MPSAPQFSPTASLLADRAAIEQFSKPACSYQSSNRRSRNRLFVLGLDGLPLSLAKRLAASGSFPGLARLVEHSAPITAELPELSPVNWTSFYTGTGPETHGIFGFSRIHGTEYTMHLADFSMVQTPTIFDRLSNAGLCCRSINLPNTYPARDIPGTMMISGFVAQELQHAVAPRFLYGPLTAHDYVLEADTERGQTDPAYLIQQLRSTLAARRDAFSLLWPDLAWDLFVCVLTETDRLFHFMFDAVEEPLYPWHAACMELLTEWDDLIAIMLAQYDALPEPKRLMALADHGFTRLITEVDINAVLRNLGLLTTALPPEACDALQSTAITPATKAFALDPGRIYIHTSERFSRGQVSAQECRVLCDHIQTALEQITFNGRPVFKAIHKREQLYAGPLMQYAPDLVCEPVAGFDCKAKFNRREIFSLHGRTGTHTVQDVFFSDTQQSTPKRVRDVGQEVLAHFGLAMNEAAP